MLIFIGPSIRLRYTCKTRTVGDSLELFVKIKVLILVWETLYIYRPFMLICFHIAVAKYLFNQVFFMSPARKQYYSQTKEGINILYSSCAVRLDGSGRIKCIAYRIYFNIPRFEQHFENFHST